MRITQNSDGTIHGDSDMIQKEQLENIPDAEWIADNELISDEEIPDAETAEDPAAGDNSCTLTVPAEMNQKRLDVILSELLSDCSRSVCRKLIEDGRVRCADTVYQKAGQKMRAGEILTVSIPKPEEINIEAEDIPLDILYEDDDVIVVNKPKGMVVHPAPGHYSGTLVNALMYHCKDSLSGINGVLRPGIVHRIDRDTTGSLVIAKNDAAHVSLSAQLKEHSINRRYRAIVHGNLPQDEGVIDAPIGRHPQDRKKMAVLRPGQGTSRDAVTHYTVLERFGQFTYIECRLETGRTHQIRVHMAHIGHPVLGDAVYGPKKAPYALEGQTLHAMVLGFIHPSTGQYMEFQAPLPEYFEQLLRKMRS